MVQESCERVEVRERHFAPNTFLPKQDDLQDIKAYFKRPHSIASGSLPASRSYFAGGNVNNLLVFGTYFNNIARLSGVYGTRYTIVYTLQIAATPFHQGVVSLGYQYETVIGGDTYNRAANVPSVTTIPHVRCDVSTTTMVQLSVPWMNTYDFLRVNSTYPLGYVSVVSLAGTPTVAGLTSATYHLYVHLEDMELISAVPEGTTTIVLNSGRSLKPMNQEFEQHAYPFSSALSSVSRAVGFVARGVPSLATIAGPASWFLSCAAGAVRAFGYSKPQIQDPVHRVMQLDTVAENNVDVASATVMVGPLASNQLTVSPVVGGTLVDEMSLAYVLQQWSQICFGFHTTSLAAGTTLYGTRVSPSYFWYREPTGVPYGNRSPIFQSSATTNSFYPSGLFYFASMFRCWRGSVKFRFTFSKTKFHAGRVIAAFIPDDVLATSFSSQDYSVLGPLSPTNPSAYSAIFDLKDSNVFEFEVPFVAAMPFLTFTGSVGSLTVTVLDTLTAPANVSPSVPFFVEVRGMPDFELSIPLGVAYPPHQSGALILQSGRLLSTSDPVASEFTIGERILSLKQLIMIPKSTMSIMSYLTGQTSQRRFIPPWFYSPTLSNTVPCAYPTIPIPSEAFSFGGAIATCYGWCRGSTDVHVYNQVPTTTDVLTYAWLNPNLFGRTPTSLSCPNNFSSSNLPTVYAGNQTALHVRFPAYARTMRVRSATYNLVSFSVGTATQPNPSTTMYANDPDAPPGIPSIGFSFNATAAGVLKSVISRSAGDDAFAVHYIGPPPMLLPSTVSAGVWDSDVLINPP